ncbi:MAG TPA: hypothetical protein DGR15_05760 [Methylophilus sp.]|nr:hypothetical protein [Methylophilus sp.]
MIERYRGDTAYGTGVGLEVSVRLAEDGRRPNAIYELVDTTHMSGIAFETSFGKPDGGYVGSRNLDDLITFGNLNTTSDALNDYFQCSTPNLYAEFVPTTKEIMIHCIERHAISSGQRFCHRTLKQLLDVTPEAKSIFFDWVTNQRTRELVLPVLKGDRDVQSIGGTEHSCALVSGLTAVGFSRLYIVRQGVEDFGIRGFRSGDTTWSL